MCRASSSPPFTLYIIVGLLVSVGPAVAVDGYFTSKQADAGHLDFNNHCAECHRPDLTGALGPALVGDTFQAHWGGKPVKALYDFAHNNMPQLAPGSLPVDDYYAVTAYILQKNGLPAGEKALSEDTAVDLQIPSKLPGGPSK